MVTASIPPARMPSALISPALISSALLPIVVATVVAAVTAGAVAVVLGRWRHHRAHRGACWVAVLPPPQADPHGGEQFWRTVTGLLLGPRWTRWFATPHVGFEYRFTASGIEIGLWVPGTVSAPLIASAVRAAWPGSRTTVTPADGLDAAPDPAGLPGRVGSAGSVVAGGALRLALPARLPLADTGHTSTGGSGGSGSGLAQALLAAPGQLFPGQWARVQILARPVSATRMRRAARPHSSPLDLLARLLLVLLEGLAGELGSLLSSGSRDAAPARQRPVSARDRRVEDGPQRQMAKAADRAVAGKLGGAPAGVLVAVRYAAATPTSSGHRPAAPPDPDHDGTGDSTGDGAARARAQSRTIAHAVASAFAQVGGHNHFRRRRLRHPERVLQARRLRRGLHRGDLLSLAEVASLAHLPVAEHVPGLRRAGAAAVAPPPQVPATGPGVRPLGDSDVTGRPVGITVPDGRHHTWVIGATGVGKSTLLARQILADADAGRAVVAVDPKGDLISEVMERLPGPARARTVLIDPASPRRLPGGELAWPCLNPLAPAPGSAVLRHGAAVGDSATEHTVTVFSRVFASAWGYRSEDLLRVSCLTLRAAKETPSLAALPALLSDPEARNLVLTKLSHESQLWEFWGWFESLSEQSQASIAAPLLNKLRAVLLRPFAQRVLCAGPSTVDLPRLLDSGGLLLVRLPKLLGEETTRLLGSLIVAQVWQSVLTRMAIPERARRDASLYLDECHNFLHLPYRAEDMLAEARGYRLSMTLAHQYLGQLTPDLRDGIAANARSKIVFLAAAEDANRLARYTLPELNAHDLGHLDAFHAAARVMASGGESRAFTLVTRPLPPPVPTRCPR